VRTHDHPYDEFKRFKKEVSLLTDERELLKKTAVYFAEVLR